MELSWYRHAETLEDRTLDHASSREGVELGFYKFANETGGVKVDVPTPPRGLFRTFSRLQSYTGHL